MALFDPKDLFKPLGAVAALAGSAALGFVAGYAVGRDPEAAKRLMRYVARGVDRATLAVAETREEIGDLWAEARAEARAESDEARFAEHEAATAAAATSAMPTDAADEPAKEVAKRARRTSTTKRARRPKA